MVEKNDESPETFKSDAKKAISKIVDEISKSSSTKQLFIGSAAGWWVKKSNFLLFFWLVNAILIRTTGYITLKVGKTAAFAVGGGIILLQIAQQKGYITIDWKKIKEKAESSSEKVESTYGKDGSKWIEKVL